MIRKAQVHDIVDVALLLKDMYVELFGSSAIPDTTIYITEIVKCMNDSTQCVYVDNELRGFFIVKDETEPMAPTIKRYNGTRVYIVPKYRNSRLLLDFYTTLFNDYPDGDILGSTEINSKHIAVLDKRHTRIANVYKLNRRM